MNPHEYQEIQALLAQPKRIAIIPHRNPDGDALGSTLGLMHLLNKLGHEATVISPNSFPDFIGWLPGAESIRIFEQDQKGSTAILESADIIFTLDFNALHRTGEMETTLAQMKAMFIMIDHHQSPDGYAKYTFSNTAYGSTCEMVYHFIDGLGKLELLDTDIATCLYTGIVTDTGSFRFPSVTPTTHKVVAHLIETGVQNGTVHSNLFDNNSLDSRRLLGQALVNLRVLPQGNVSYITLSQDELDQFHYVKGDTEGIVNFGLSVKGVIFTAIFIENREEKAIKISFRSRGNFDVNAFARAHFNGGGHINAAGGKSYLSLQDTVHHFKGLVSQIQF